MTIPLKKDESDFGDKNSSRKNLNISGLLDEDEMKNNSVGKRNTTLNGPNKKKPRKSKRELEKSMTKKGTKKKLIQSKD